MKKISPHRTWRLARQNTPKIRTADVWVLGAILPLVLLVFYGDLLRILLEFCCPPVDFQTWEFLRFFAYDFPKAAETLVFLASSRFPYLPSNSTEFGNPGHTRNAVGRLKPAQEFKSLYLRQRQAAASHSRTAHWCSSRIFMPTLVPCVYFANTPHEKPHSVLLGTFFLLAILVVFKATTAPLVVPEKPKLEENRDWK